MKAKVAAAKNIRKWEQISVEAPETRAYEFFADVSFAQEKPQSCKMCRQLC